MDGLYINSINKNEVRKMNSNKLKFEHPTAIDDELFVPIVTKSDMDKILKKNTEYFPLKINELEKLEKITLTDIDMKNFEPKKVKRVIGVWQKNPPIIASAYDVSKDDLSIKDDKASWDKGDNQFTWIVDELAPKASSKNMVMGIANDSDVKISLENPKRRNNGGK